MVIGPTARAAAKILAKAKHKARAVVKKSRRKVNKRILSRKVLNEGVKRQRPSQQSIALSVLTPREEAYRQKILREVKVNRKWRKEHPEQVRDYWKKKHQANRLRTARETAWRQKSYIGRTRPKPNPHTPYRDPSHWTEWSQQSSLSAAELVARRARIRALQMKAIVKKQSVRNIGANPLRKGSTKAQMKAKVDAMRKKIQKIQKAKSLKIAKSKSKKIVKKKGRKKGRKR